MDNETYEQENLAYLKGQTYDNVRYAFWKKVNYETALIDLIDFLSCKNPKLLKKFMIKTLSNSNEFTLEDLKKLFEVSK